jgi:hypothetical protein
MDRDKAYPHEESRQLCSLEQYAGYHSHHRRKAEQPFEMRLWPLLQRLGVLHSEHDGRRPSSGLPTKPNDYSYDSYGFQGSRALKKDQEALQGQQRPMDVRYSTKPRSIRPQIRE